MSALPPKADMCGANTDVRFGPIADIRWANADSASNLVTIYLVAQMMKEPPCQDSNYCHQRYQEQNFK